MVKWGHPLFANVKSDGCPEKVPEKSILIFNVAGADARLGSHMLVVGNRHNYALHGGTVLGHQNMANDFFLCMHK